MYTILFLVYYHLSFINRVNNKIALRINEGFKCTLFSINSIKPFHSELTNYLYVINCKYNFKRNEFKSLH